MHCAKMPQVCRPVIFFVYYSAFTEQVDKQKEMSGNRKWLVNRRKNIKQFYSIQM
jgi:hypothetical protein